MFKIFDGRSYFYQWDKDRILIVEDPSITEVHFCNRTDDCSLVCEVYDKEGIYCVNVPNILLQQDWPIKAYAYCGFTKVEETFLVKKRTKPADYIYTETEIKNYDDLAARVDEIEKNGVSQEAIDAAVGAYLEENPIEAGATEAQAAQIEQNRVDIAELQNKEVDLTGYATEDYVDDAIKGIKIPEVDLSNYYTKGETDAAIDAAIDSIKIPDVSNLATKEEVQAIDRYYYNNYYNKAEVDEKIPDVSAYQTEAQVIALINANMPASGDEVSY